MILKLDFHNEIKAKFDKVIALPDQKKCYEQVGLQMTNHFLKGYNCTTIAYGESRSGKTFSMFGDQSLLEYPVLP